MVILQNQSKTSLIYYVLPMIFANHFIFQKMEILFFIKKKVLNALSILNRFFLFLNVFCQILLTKKILP